MLSAGTAPRTHQDHGSSAVGQPTDRPRPTDPATPQAPADTEPSALAGALMEALSALRTGSAERGGPLPAADPVAVRERVGAALAAAPLPEQGVGTTSALRALCALAGWGAADASDPMCAGRLHTPPMPAAEDVSAST